MFCMDEEGLDGCEAWELQLYHLPRILLIILYLGEADRSGLLDIRRVYRAPLR